MKMFFRLLLIFFIFLSQVCSSQILKPVKWTFSAERDSAENVLVHLDAKIDKGWHIYSTNLPEGSFVIPTSFHFNKSDKYLVKGKIVESRAITEYDSIFKMEFKFFEKNASFTQRVIAKTSEEFEVTGYLEYSVCDDDGKCLPPEEVEFRILVKKGVSALSTSDTSASSADTTAGTVDTSAVEKGKTVIKDFTPKTKSLNLLAVFIAGFIGGLFALFTPCVFPMVPLTVSFFTKQSKTRKKGVTNALIYAASIIIIYVGFGLLITTLLGPDALNALASSAIMNMIFFIVFIIFACSFLGAFEITLPASWITKADSASEQGGLVGIFFMAFTLSLVSFSCTGPIIGTLLVEAAVGGHYMGPFMGMAGFAIALAFPFGLFAAFPGWLNSLPKSGGWLNSVKVVLGFLELALALKFFSNVDLAYSWGILKREIFLALWIVIFSLMGLYLLGKIKFSHDSDLPYVSVPRTLLSIIVFAFVIYLIPGLFGAPLKLVSGFPPPMFYNEGWTLTAGSSKPEKEDVPGIDRAHCPHNLPCFHDYDLALEHARKIKKPLLIDFTGWSCVNCRKMEDYVWVDDDVLRMLEDDFVIVSLYVDDKSPLDPKDQYVSKTSGKKVRSVGAKWSDFQATRYNTNSQPYYVIIDNNEQLLEAPRGYDLDINNFTAFLKSAKAGFDQTGAE